MGTDPKDAVVTLDSGADSWPLVMGIISELHD